MPAGVQVDPTSAHARYRRAPDESDSSVVPQSGGLPICVFIAGSRSDIGRCQITGTPGASSLREDIGVIGALDASGRGELANGVQAKRVSVWSVQREGVRYDFRNM